MKLGLSPGWGFKSGLHIPGRWRREAGAKRRYNMKVQYEWIRLTGFTVFGPIQWRGVIDTVQHHRAATDTFSSHWLEGFSHGLTSNTFPLFKNKSFHVWTKVSRKKRVKGAQAAITPSIKSRFSSVMLWQRERNEANVRESSVNSWWPPAPPARFKRMLH